METAATVSEYDKRSWTQMFLDDYELQVGPLVSQRCRRYLQGSRAWFYWLAWDFLLCYFVIGALMVTFWRSAWLMASEAFEAAFEDCVYVNLASLAVGLTVSFFLNLFQDFIRNRLGGGDENMFRFKLTTLVFSTMLGFFDIWYWKGLWDGIYCFFDFDLTTAGCSLILGLPVLIGLKAFRSVISCPIGTTVDAEPSCCFASTWWNTTPKDPFGKRVLDVLITLTVEVFVMLSWSGVWVAFDVFTLGYGYKDLDFENQAWFSFGLGFLAASLAFAIQFPVLRYLRSPKSAYLSKLLMSYVFDLFAYYATVASFRGYWNLLEYYLPNIDENFMGSVVHPWCYSVLLLAVLLNISTINPGIQRDDPELLTGEQGFLIRNYYTTHFYIQDVERKLLALKEDVESIPTIS